jgi:hypothetical protein
MSAWSPRFKPQCWETFHVWRAGAEPEYEGPPTPLNRPSGSPYPVETRGPAALLVRGQGGGGISPPWGSREPIHPPRSDDGDEAGLSERPDPAPPWLGGERRRLHERRWGAAEPIRLPHFLSHFDGFGCGHAILTGPPPGGFTVPGASLLPLESPTGLLTSYFLASSWFLAIS